MKTLIKEKQNKGITLIALVITIIVLLILAGVTIATLTGDNGLLTKTSDAKNKNTEAEIEEQIRLAWNDYYLAQHTETSYTFQDSIDKVFGEGKATVTPEGENFIVVYGDVTKKVDTLNGTIANAETEEDKDEQEEEKEEVVLDTFEENTSETEMLIYVKTTKTAYDYYALGDFNNWTIQGDTYKLQKMNIENDTFDYYKMLIPDNTTFKVTAVEPGKTTVHIWFPEGMDTSMISYPGTTHFISLNHTDYTITLDTTIPDNW